jgi:2-(1,2-epoxy-1,2-dihydrophenyl)acetyl-CoA isomerase
VSWLEIRDEGQIRWMVLDRPERRNAVPPDGWGQLAEEFARFEGSEARVLVVTGAGGAFCSGADLDPSATPGEGVVARHQRMKLIGEAATRLHRLSKPTIAAVDGVAVGAGMNLALGCDVVLASTRARFAEIFVRRGLTVDFGGSWLLPRVVGIQRAKELALSGRMVGADEALRLGLCMEVVEPERLVERTREVASGFLEGAPVAQMLAKRCLDRSWELSFEQALAWEGQAQAICFQTEDVAEGIAAFLEKRTPRWQGR